MLKTHFFSYFFLFANESRMLKTKQKIRKNCNLKKDRVNDNKLLERTNAYNSIVRHAQN